MSSYNLTANSEAMLAIACGEKELVQSSDLQETYYDLANQIIEAKYANAPLAPILLNVARMIRKAVLEGAEFKKKIESAMEVSVTALKIEDVKDQSIRDLGSKILSVLESREYRLQAIQSTDTCSLIELLTEYHILKQQIIRELLKLDSSQLL